MVSVPERHLGDNLGASKADNGAFQLFEVPLREILNEWYNSKHEFMDVRAKLTVESVELGSHASSGRLRSI